MRKQVSEMEKDFDGFLPELPETAIQFIGLTRQLNTTKKSYANLLLSDPLLSSRVFSYVNYVLNPGNATFISINKGVSLMGLHKFKNVVMAFSLFPLFEKAGCIDLYKYSLLTAYFCKDIAMQFSIINPHDAFLLGFLHDIGMLALKNKFPDYKTVLYKSDSIQQEMSLQEEFDDYRYCHSDLSEFICRRWSLPVIVVDAIKYHHFPMDAMLPQAASIIYLADVLAHKNSRTPKEAYRVFHYMRLNKNDLVTRAQACERKMIPYFEILGI